DLGGLVPVGHTEADAGVLGSGLPEPGDEIAGVVVDLGANSGHAHGRGRVDEAAAALDDAGQTLRRRRRRGQEDPVEIIAVGGGQPVVGLVRDEIGGDDSASAGGVEVPGEVSHAVLEHEVPVAHDYGGAACLGDGLDGGEHVLRAHP